MHLPISGQSSTEPVISAGKFDFFPLFLFPVCLFFFFLKGFLKSRLSNAINIALLYFLFSDGTTEESSISGKLYLLFAFIRVGGGGNYACKIKRLTPTI